MSDRKPNWLEQSEAMLDVMRTNQKTLQDNWKGFLDELQSGWDSGAFDESVRPAGGGEHGPSARSDSKTGPQAASLGFVGSQIHGTRRTVEALGDFAKQVLGTGASGLPDAAAAWKRAGELLLEPWLQPLMREDETPKTVEDFFGALMAPWGAGVQGFRPTLEWLRDGLGQIHRGMASSSMSHSMDTWDQLSSLVGKCARHPSLGPIDPELAQRSTEAFEAWLACLGAIQRYETLRLETWTRVGERFVASLADGGADGQSIDSLRGLLQHWVDVGDGVLMEMYRSEEYLELQRELLECLMRYRVKLQDVQESFARSTGLPTRRELDDAYRSIQLLRREVRLLKRAHRVDRGTTVAVGAERVGDAGELERQRAPKSEARNRSAAKKASSRKSSAKKSGSRKASAKKASSKRSTSKKTASKKTSSKRSGSKKTASKKVSSKKTSAS